MRCFQTAVLPFRAVLNPRSVAGDGEALERLNGWGLPFMALRWLAYVPIYALRDYDALQPPFVATPFGLDLELYRVLETYTAPLFGALLITVMVYAVGGYLRLRGKSVSSARILDAIGVAFFVPWLIVALVDLFVIHTVGWRMEVVIPIHTLFLAWESWAAVELAGGRVALKTADKVALTLLLMFIWIALCAVWWR